VYDPLNMKSIVLLASLSVIVCAGCGSAEPCLTDCTGGGGFAGMSAGGSGGGDSPCAEGCALTVAAACDNGPVSQAACESDCEAQMTGACAAEYQVVQTCAEGQGVTCGAQGTPTVEACRTELDAFVACLN
jgi:hypothetical protein